MADNPSNYTVLDPHGVVVNIIIWDGNEKTWNVENVYGPGYTVRPFQEGDAIPTPPSE